MSNVRHNLDQVKERVKEYLPQYLIQMGVHVNGRGLFKCINPSHSDNNPSCGIVPESDNKVFHCFACRSVGNIFHAAAFLEGKPLSGVGFLHDNLIYLATRFGVEVPEFNPTPEEIYEMEIYSAYSHAAMYVRSCTLSDRVKTKVATLGWSADVMLKTGTGSVTSYEDYMSRMTKPTSEGGFGHKLDFLREVDLTRKALFNPDNLIFTIKDEHGAPVGFAARNLKYEEEKANYDKQKQDIINLNGEDAPQLKELWHPTKYINTAETGMKNHIYQKSKRLYNFDRARKRTPPLYVVEGYSDAVTMDAAGIHNVCAIGSISFTKEHLNLVLNVGDKNGESIKHIIFVLDADDAGEEGTRRFVAMLEETMAGHIGLRVEIISMPEGTDDPDAFIRMHGLANGGAALRNLEHLDMFSWRLRKAIKDGEDPLTLSERIIPMIVNEQNYLQRMRMSEQLASQTGLDKQGVWREVMRRVDDDAMRLEEEKVLIAKRTSSELARNSKDIQSILSSAQIQVELIERRRLGYDPSNVMKSVEYVFEQSEANISGIELITGFKHLDEALGGMPKAESFLSVPGKPNQAKTTFLQNLTWRLLDNNPNVIVLFHTVDDALSAFVPRMLGGRYNLPSVWFKRSGYYMNDPVGIKQTQEWLQQHDITMTFEELHGIANQWIRKQIESERLVLADVVGLPGSLPALETWVKNLRQKFPDKPLIVIGDNFHLFDLPGYDIGEGKTREMSMFIKRLANQQRCTCIFSCELPKESLRPGVRPRVSRIKGTSGVAYDANANLGVYNDLKDLESKATIFWTDDKDLDTVIGNGGICNHVPKRKPIIEIVIDKSKLSSFDGTIYYKLWPETGRMEEVSDEEQSLFRSRAAEYNGSEMSSSYATNRRM